MRHILFYDTLFANHSYFLFLFRFSILMKCNLKVIENILKYISQFTKGLWRFAVECYYEPNVNFVECEFISRGISNVCTPCLQVALINNMKILDMLLELHRTDTKTTINGLFLGFLTSFTYHSDPRPNSLIFDLDIY